MQVKIAPSWGEKLQSEFDAPYFSRLTQFVRKEYATGPCYPPGNQIFNAFNLCPFDKVKVVILGQDPYHEEGQAEGLCFSVADGVQWPPSLQNIFKEIEGDLHRPAPATGSLRRWAEQGVLLLNSTLTVRAHQAASHAGQGWKLLQMPLCVCFPMNARTWCSSYGVVTLNTKEQLSIVNAIWF